MTQQSSLISHAVVILASICDELVGKDLGYPGAVGRAVRPFFPLVKVLFRVDLDFTPKNLDFFDLDTTPSVHEVCMKCA